MSRFISFGFANILPRRVLLAGVGGCLTIGLMGQAVAPQEITAETKITRIMDFWPLSVEERSRSLPVELEVQVLYNDPERRVVQVRDESGFEYVEVPASFQARAEDVVKLVGRTAGNPFTFALELDSWSVVGKRALAAESVDLSDLDHSAATDRVVSVVGLVERQFLDDPRHLNLQMAVDGLRVRVIMLLDPDEPEPQWTGGLLRVKGVYAPKFNAEGDLSLIEMWSPGVDSVQWIATLANAALFDIPVVEAEKLYEGDMAAGAQVRVRGEYVGESREGGLLLRDASGQLIVESAQGLRPERGDRIEAVGFVDVSGVELRLRRALWRSTELEDAAAEELNAPLRRHRVAASVRELSPIVAAAGEQVAITGVVTWSDVRRDLIFVQDSSAGIAVKWDESIGERPSAGKLVRIEGVTAAGDFAPYVVVTASTEVSDLVLPEAHPITRDQAMTGLEEAQLVALTGYVFEAEQGVDEVRLGVSTSSGEMAVKIAGKVDATQWLGSVIRASGVCVARADKARRLVEAEIWVATPMGIEVLQDSAEDPFDLPFTPMRELGRFNPNAILRDRLRVHGTVVWVEETGGIWLNDDDATLQVHTRQDQRPSRREQIEVVGFLGMSDGQRILREAVWRSTGRGSLPEVKVMTDSGQGLKHGLMARIEGRVDEITGWSDKVRMVLYLAQQPPVVVEIPTTTPEKVRLHAPEGSIAEVTGLVWRTPNAAPGEPQLRLLVSDILRIKTLQFPPWWTRERLMGFGLVAILVVAFVLLWAGSLKRQVRKQTAQINDQNDRARQMQEELERTQRMESMGSMAEGITQDFEQLLQRTHLQIGEVLNRERFSWDSRNRLDQAQAAVLRAQDLTRRLASFSLTGKSVLCPLDWADFLRKEVTSFEVEPSIKLNWNLPPEVPPVRADTAQMQQVIQAILRNAMQAMPAGGTIKISLSEERVDAGDLTHLLTPGDYLCTSIADSGGGVAAEDLTRVFDPYFSRKQGAKGLGLAVAYAAMRQHRGRIEIDSTPGNGTTVFIWLPFSRDGEPS